MKKDPTAFRERFKAWKDGKDPYRYLYDDQSGNWNRITDDETADAFANFVATPNGSRPTFSMYENTPNPTLPISKNESVVPDNTLWTRQQVEKANNTRTWRSDVADVMHAIGEGAMLASTFAAPEVEPLVYPAYLMARQYVINYTKQQAAPVIISLMMRPQAGGISGIMNRYSNEIQKTLHIPTKEKPIENTFTTPWPLNSFKSNIDWSAENWFKNISGRDSYSQEEAAELASFVPEYNKLEELFIKDGTLMFDDNGVLVVKGSNVSPQEYIMRHSKEFQKMNPEHHYVGVSKGRVNRFETIGVSDFDVWTTRTKPQDVEEYAISPGGGHTVQSLIDLTEHQMSIREENYLLHQEQLAWKLKYGWISLEKYDRDMEALTDMYKWKQELASKEIEQYKKQLLTDPLNGGKIYDVTYPMNAAKAKTIDAGGAHWGHIPYNVDQSHNTVLTSTDLIVSENIRNGYGITNINNVMDTYNGNLLNETIIHRGVPVKSVLGNTGKFDIHGPNKFKRFRIAIPYILGGNALYGIHNNK